MKLLFFLLLATNAFSIDYFDLIPEVGDHQKGEIEIITDKEMIEKAEETQRKRLLKNRYDEKDAWEYSRVGIVAEDQYIYWIRDAVIFPKGIFGTYDRIMWKSAIDGELGMAVLPILEDGSFLLILTYRHATRSWELEIPRGRRAEGEDIFQTLERELMEEAGGKVEKMGFLGSVAPDSGILTSVVPVFWAKVSEIGNSDIEDSEAIEGNVILKKDALKEAFIHGLIEIGEKKAYVRDPFLAFALLQETIRSQRIRSELSGTSMILRQSSISSFHTYIVFCMRPNFSSSCSLFVLIGPHCLLSLSR